MKKSITILTICLLVFTETQNAQAQTKEETVKWIEKKLWDYGGSGNISLTNIRVTPCEISWRLNHIYDYSTESFNPSTIKNYTTISSGSIYVEPKVIRVVRNEDKSVYMDNVILIQNGELDLLDRMVKALTHLATFCDEGKNEAF